MCYNKDMSQQGKPYTEEQKTMIIESLRTFLEMGFSRNRACTMVGFDPTTLSKWVVNDPALSIKLQAWENTINAMALANIYDAIKREGELQDDVKKENSWKWAERKMKADFSPRQELTGADGEQLFNRETKELLDGIIDEL